MNMKISETYSTQFKLYISRRIAAVRILFGVVWVIDAVFKFEPAFWHHQALIGYIKAVDMGMPSWLNPWFHTWFRIIGAQPTFYAFLILVIETLIALSLIFGVARRLIYAIGVPFSFLIWSVGENFGGPYSPGSTDIGAGFIYVIVFLLLYFADSIVTPSWSLDPLIEKHISWWHFIATAPNRFKQSSIQPNSDKKKVAGSTAR
jgi:thiosulfate dehydrogenase [quinone] large subunit